MRKNILLIAVLTVISICNAKTEASQEDFEQEDMPLSVSSASISDREEEEDQPRSRSSSSPEELLEQLKGENREAYDEVMQAQENGLTFNPWELAVLAANPGLVRTTIRSAEMQRNKPTKP